MSPLINVRCKCCPLPLTEPQLKGIFKRFDGDGDGLLSREELIKAFEHLGSRWPGWRAHRALYYADRNGDGYINETELEEVIKYAHRHNYKMP